MLTHAARQFVFMQRFFHNPKRQRGILLFHNPKRQRGILLFHNPKRQRGILLWSWWAAAVGLHVNGIRSLAA